MALVDARGRLFGRVNLVDAFLILVLLGLIPLAYGAYVLFRTPPPRLTAVEPATLPYGAPRVTLRGEHLRPYMRASFGDFQGTTFLFNSSSVAEIDLPDLKPGTYDVILYDYAQERARLPKALTILPPPAARTSVEIVGAFRNLPVEVSARLVAGTDLAGFGTVLKTARPVPSVTRARAGVGTVEIPVEAMVDVPAVVRLSCTLIMTGGEAHCVSGDIRLEPDAFVTLATPFGQFPFQVDQVRATTPVEDLEVTVRFVGDPDVLGLLRSGDVDVGVSRNELASGAIVTNAGPVRRLSSQLAVLSESQVVTGEVSARDVTLRVPAQQSASGFRYAGRGLRVGGAFPFQTLTYELHGSVTRMTPGAASKREERD